MVELQFDWEDLILKIEDRRIIPVVGPDLLQVTIDGHSVRLFDHIADLLADRLELHRRELPEPFELADVASVYARRHRRQQRKVLSRLRAILEEVDVQTPPALEKLAAITTLDLFLTTTFDPFLARALDTVRFGGSPLTETIAYGTHSRIADLPCDISRLERPVVYQLFGSASDCALTDEDVLEFVHRLQSDSGRPKLLFDELKANDLLLIGCSYPNWLSRFFIRTLRDERLSIADMTEVIADDRTPGDHDLVQFLSRCAAEIYPEVGAVAFVDELHRRWCERHPPDRSAPPPGAATMPRMAPDAIFLSYASEDRTAVMKLKEGLERVGLDVWFDQRSLQSGDDWDREIQRNIKRCSLFIPVISRNACARREGYFRKEWKLANDRAQWLDETFPFIQPVVVDDTPAEADGIPDYFHTLTWQWFEGGTPSEEFLDRARQIVRALREEQRR